MRTQYAAGIAMVLGIGIGAVSVGTLHAQTKPKPPVYVIAENEVSNPQGYAKEYLPPAQAAIKKYGGRYVAAGKPTAIDGDPPKASRVVVLMFDSMEQARKWHDSPEYQGARKFGNKYATYHQFVVDGVAQ